MRVCTSSGVVLILVWLLAAGTLGEAKNVVHIILDDCRPEMGAYGVPHAYTPNIDALAKRGTVFDLAMAQQTVCGPSRNSIYSGTRPDRSKSYNFINHFRETFPPGSLSTIPGMFLDAGRLALGAGKTYHPKLPPAYDSDNSWSKGALPYRNPCWNTADDPNAKFQDGGLPCVPCLVDIKHYIGHGNVSVANEFCETDAFEDTLAIADAVHQLKTSDPKQLAKGFYLGVGLRKPHLPWQAAPEDWAKHPSIDNFSLPTHPFPPVGMPPLAFHMTDSTVRGNPFEAPLSPTLTKTARRAYAASLTGMDRKLTVLFQAIDDMGLANSTAIVLHSDHSFHLGEKSEWRKFTLFENAAKVPFIVAAPWIPNSANRRSSGLVELVDLLPTIADLAELPLPSTGQPIDGTSVVPLLSDTTEGQWNKTGAFTQYPRDVRNPAEAWNDNSIIHTDRSEFTHMGLSVRSHDWRFNLWLGWNKTSLSPVWDDVAGMELYDHRNETLYPVDFDSTENVNVANRSENAAVVSELTAMLKDMFQHDKD